MKLMKKYVLSCVVDNVIVINIITVVWILLQFLLKITDAHIQFAVIALIMTTTYVFHPLLFKNATIGMRIIGLRIVDKEGNCPPPKMILYRQMNFVVLAKECRTLYMNNEDMDYLGLKTVGTHIIDIIE